MSTVVRHHARRFGTQIALVDLDRGLSTTWVELESRVAALAAVLIHRYGVRPGDRLAHLASDRPMTIELLFASMRVGAIFVPLNRRLSAPEIEALCVDAQPLLVIYDDPWAEAATKLSAALGCPAVGIDGDLEPAVTEQQRTNALPTDPDYPLGSNEPVMLLYTSGTTGLPKGAVITEGMLLAHTMNVLDSLGIAGPPAIVLSILPLFHAAGLLSITLPVLLRGGCVWIAGRFDPVASTALLTDAAQGITHVTLAPIMAAMIAEEAGPTADFSHVRHGLVGGGHLADELAGYFRARGLEMQAGWGATEMGPSSTVMPTGFAARYSHTVGQTVPFVRLRVVLPGGRDAAVDEMGEAWVSGPAISPGYWRRPPEQDESRSAGWFRSGDAVSVDAADFVSFRGRYKDMYKSGGENVFTAEVERVLMDHPGVAEVAVIGVSHSRWGEAGRAIIVRAEGSAASVDEIVVFCRTRLAGYKVPAEIVFTDHLPRNVTGKVQKIDLLKDFGTPIAVRSG